MDISKNLVMLSLSKHISGMDSLNRLRQAQPDKQFRFLEIPLFYNELGTPHKVSF